MKTVIGISNVDKHLQSILAMQREQVGEKIMAPAQWNVDWQDEHTVVIVARIEDRIQAYAILFDSKKSRKHLGTLYTQENAWVLAAAGMINDNQSKNSYDVLRVVFFAALRYAQQNDASLLCFARNDSRDSSGIVDQLALYTIMDQEYGKLYSVPIANTVNHLHARNIDELLSTVVWDMPLPIHENKKAYHGGAFFKAIGEDFSTLDKRHRIINADVLDAWFPPAPAITEEIKKHLDWLIRTSPPTHSSGLLTAIAEARGVSQKNLVVGGGSSDLMFLALGHLLNDTSRVLILEPTYGEYRHILKNVIGCGLEKFLLYKKDGYKIDLERLNSALSEHAYDLMVLVNPNSPTGLYCDSSVILELIRNHPRTMFWVDETYIEYIGSQYSLEKYATQLKNMVICKSMSKVYALSGARCAYLVTHEDFAAALNLFSPPWAVSSIGQMAGVIALRESKYYEDMYELTRKHRDVLTAKLRDMKRVTSVIEGRANFLLFFFDDARISRKELILNCRNEGVFIRDASEMGITLGSNAIRLAVKSEEENALIIKVLQKYLNE